MSDEQADQGREPHLIPPMSPEKWNDFVRDVASGHAFTSHDAPPDLLGSIFAPLLLGGLAGWTEEELDQVGCIWELYSEAGPRSINGYPMFLSCRLVNRHDWERAIPEINRRRAILCGQDPS